MPIGLSGSPAVWLTQSCDGTRIARPSAAEAMGCGNANDAASIRGDDSGGGGGARPHGESRQPRRAGPWLGPAGQYRPASGARCAGRECRLQSLRQSVPLRGQPAEDRAVAGREPYRIAGRSDLGIQAAPRRQVPRRQPGDGRGRRLQLSAGAEDRQGAGGAVPAGAEAGQASPRPIRRPSGSGSKSPTGRFSPPCRW